MVTRGEKRNNVRNVGREKRTGDIQGEREWNRSKEARKKKGRKEGKADRQAGMKEGR